MVSRQKDPVWAEYVLLPAENGKAARVQCIHCDHTFAQSGATRLRSHIIGGVGVTKCAQAPDEVVAKYSGRVTAVRSQPSILAAFGSSRVLTADAAVADFVFEEGLAFAKVESPAFKRMLSAVSKCPGYSPPKRTRLSTTLLGDAYDRSKVKVQPIVDAATSSVGNTPGYSLCSDGATDITSRPLVNVVLTSASGNVFLNAHDTSGKPKKAKFIADLLADHLEALGPDHCVLVVTDNAANCKKAGQLIEERYPHITWTGCLAHCMDLMLKDIGQLGWVAPLITDVKQVFTFIRKHSQPLALYRKHNPNLALITPGDTRFGSNFIMLERFLAVVKPLQAMLSDPEWDEWVHDQGKKVQARAEAARKTIRSKSTKRLVRALVPAIEPMVKLLRMADSEVPCTGKVYHNVWSLKQLLLDSALSTVNQMEVRYQSCCGVSQRSGAHACSLCH